VETLGLVLDDGRLEGAQPVERLVGPERIAVVVDANDVADARTAIEDLCLRWGGACGAVLVAERGTHEFPSRWESFLLAEAFDNLATRGVLEEDDEQHQRPEVFSLDFVKGEPLLTILWSHHRKPEEWATCDCALPDPEDPWYLAYLGCLGAWPDQPRREHLVTTGLVEDYKFEQMLRVERGLVAEPGPEDLVRRMRRQNFTTPTRLSVVGLSLWRLPEASHMTDDLVLPRRRWERSRYGSNLVVVYEPRQR
jgi:hypothetical protein